MGRQASPKDPSQSPPQGERVLVCGEVLFDHFPDGTRVLGGAPFNVAWHLCGFGLPPLLVSAVGDDPEGRRILDQMEGWGMSSRAIQIDPDHPTGRVDVDKRGNGPAYRIPPGQAWDHIDADEALTHVPEEAVALVYHGTLALRHPDSAEACRRLADAAGAPILVDVNLREPWWSPEGVAAALDGATWAKMSLEELWTLSEGDEGTLDEAPAAARELLARHDLKRVVVT